MRKKFLAGLLVAALSVSTVLVGEAAPPPVTGQLDIDGQDTGKVFDGFGAQSSGGTTRLLYDYPEPQRGQVLDYLFKPGYGASLQHLKVEIGGDGNSSNGAEASHEHRRGEENFHTGYEWWLMAEGEETQPEHRVERAGVERAGLDRGR